MVGTRSLFDREMRHFVKKTAGFKQYGLKRLQNAVADA